MSLEIRCSFCDASQKEVRKLVAGPSVYICDVCVYAIERVMSLADLADDKIVAKSVADPKVACSFCGKSSSEVRHLVEREALGRGERGPQNSPQPRASTRICNECVQLCDDILWSEAS